MLKSGTIRNNIDTYLDFIIVYNGLGYEQLRGVALNFASTHQAENPQGFSEVNENKQLLIAIVGCSFFISVVFLYPFVGAKL